MRWISPVLMSFALSLLASCGAISSLSKASEEFDAYTLSPAVGRSTPLGGNRHLIVELPTSAGALGTDRILIKPLPYQAQYLPDGRWTEPAPALVQTLLIESFQSLGGFRLVGRTANGLNPDYTLMTELLDFQAQPVGPDPEGYLIQISVVTTLIRESDRRIVASNRFSATEKVGSDDTLTLVGGFDRALKNVLQPLVIWTGQQVR